MDTNGIQKEKVLMVGAGGIGCELLKTLVLTGFEHIHLIDMDTIEVSNLNRQFLFRKSHVGQSKAKVAREAVLKFRPKVEIVAHHANVKNQEFDIDFFKQFSVVLNGLDNLEARRHVNRMCLAAGVPLVESGTTGYLGQVTVHIKGQTECYECQPKPAPKSYPVCTITSTPSKLIHCIVWAKELALAKLFGDKGQVSDLDVRPTSNEDGAVSNDPDEAQFFEVRSGESSKAYAERVFDRIFGQNIVTALQNEDTWKARRRPDPLFLEKVLTEDVVMTMNGVCESSEGAISASASLGLKNPQETWSVKDNARVFLESVQLFLDKRSKDVGKLVFDKDDQLAVEFVTAAANLRAHSFGIPMQSLFEAKGMAGNIIHAIATTNAIIAGLIVLEALKILSNKTKECRCVYFAGSFGLVFDVGVQHNSGDHFAMAMEPAAHSGFSAGKVLITGAYLVLEQPHAGLVVSTSARFYAVVKPIHQGVAPDSWSWSWTDVRVISPQLEKETDYKLSHRDVTLQKVSSEGGSPFVEQAVQLAVAAVKAGLVGASTDELDLFRDQLLQGIEITILGSNDFYSFRKQLEARRLPVTHSSLASLPAFSPITSNSQPVEGEVALPEVAKTGLGSSAAMTTAVVAALLQYLGRIDLPLRGGVSEDVEADLNLVHSVAQAAHCAAQGKIGSGFDVSCAVYGSQRYVRFSPSVVSSAQASGRLVTPLEVMKQVLSESWDGDRLPYALPPGLMLVVGEPGFGGSHTPSMVGAVQAWRKRDPEKAKPVWAALAEANLSVEKGLLHLRDASHSGEAYKSTLQACCTTSADKWRSLHGDSPESLEVVTALLETREAFLQVRSLLRHVGEAAGVPIEPSSQTALLDATMDMEGVLVAGVPGAGGFDAVFAVTIGSTVREKVASNWSSRGVLSSSVQEDPEGVRLEKADPREA